MAMTMAAVLKERERESEREILGEMRTRIAEIVTYKQTSARMVRTGGGEETYSLVQRAQFSSSLSL